MHTRISHIKHFSCPATLVNEDRGGRCSNEFIEVLMRYLVPTEQHTLRKMSCRSGRAAARHSRTRRRSLPVRLLKPGRSDILL